MKLNAPKSEKVHGMNKVGHTLKTKSKNKKIWKLLTDLSASQNLYFFGFRR